MRSSPFIPDYFIFHVTTALLQRPEAGFRNWQRDGDRRVKVAQKFGHWGGLKRRRSCKNSNQSSELWQSRAGRAGWAAAEPQVPPEHGSALTRISGAVWIDLDV